MKIFFFTTYINTPHYETELELMENHLQAGDEVVQIVCNGVLETCLHNPDHNLIKCIDCIKKRKAGSALLGKSIRNIDLEKYFDRQEKFACPTFDTIQDLKKYQVGNFDVGYAIASTVIDLYRQGNPDMKQISGMVSSLLETSLKMYSACERLIKAERPDLVYIFNGRFAIERAVLRASEIYGTRFINHERGSGKDFYEKFVNLLPHLATLKTDLISDYWENGASDKREVAKAFFEDRVKRKDQGWVSFLGDQVFGKLPESFRDDLKTVVIYTSSEFEYASIGQEWENDIYSSTVDAVTKINAFLNMNPLGNEYKIYVRIHPYVKQHFHEEEALVAALNGELNFEIISSKSDVCSYSLLKKASKVISLGSTIGIEAAYWGKPSVLMGPSSYANLGSTYNVSSIKEVFDLVLDKDLPPLPIDGALKYGYYLQTYGSPFTHYRAESLFDGTFKGKNLNAASREYTRHRKLSVLRLLETSVFSVSRKVRRLISKGTQ